MWVSFTIPFMIRLGFFLDSFSAERPREEDFNAICSFSDLSDLVELEIIAFSLEVSRIDATETPKAWG